MEEKLLSDITKGPELPERNVTSSKPGPTRTPYLRVGEITHDITSDIDASLSEQSGEQAEA